MTHSTEIDKMNQRINDLESDTSSLKAWKEVHVKDYDAFKADTEGGLDKVVEAVYQNTHTMTELIKQTKGVVELHRDVSGAFRIAVKLQKFMIFLTKWGVVGGIVVLTTDWIRTTFPSLF